MSIKVDVESDDYRFYKTLNEDVKLVQNKYAKWDICIENGDYVNVTGKHSLYNAIVIAIKTRFQELKDIPLYENFGCRVHELIKARKSEMLVFKLELFTRDVLENIRRIKEVKEIRITDSSDEGYEVYFNVVSINDETVNGSVIL